jgi:hypothetical protein
MFRCDPNVAFPPIYHLMSREFNGKFNENGVYSFPEPPKDDQK